MSDREVIWNYIFELYNVKSYEELREKLKSKYSIVLLNSKPTPLHGLEAFCQGELLLGKKRKKREKLKYGASQS
jgi:hypothetical protein